LNDDLYKRGVTKAAGIPVLPKTLLHAVEAFDADPISRAAFGDSYKDIYLSHKLREWERTFLPGDRRATSRTTHVHLTVRCSRG